MRPSVGPGRPEVNAASGSLALCDRHGARSGGGWTPSSRSAPRWPRSGRRSGASPTFVAQDPLPSEIFATVAAELGGLLGARDDAPASLRGTAPLDGRRRLEHLRPPAARDGVDRRRRAAGAHDRAGRRARADRRLRAGDDLASRRSCGGSAPARRSGRRSWSTGACGGCSRRARAAGTLPESTEPRLMDFAELVGSAVASAESRLALSRLADSQAALRRVATLVARERQPADVFGAVAEEARGLDRLRHHRDPAAPSRRDGDAGGRRRSAVQRAAGRLAGADRRGQHQRAGARQRPPRAPGPLRAGRWTARRLPAPARGPLRRGRADPRRGPPVGRAARRLLRAAAGERRAAPGGVRRAGRRRDLERRGARRARRLARAYRDRRRRDAPPDRARPARRDPAAARLARTRAARRAVRDRGAPGRGAAQDRRGRRRPDPHARRPARDLARHPPGDPRRRARTRAQGARPAQLGAGRARHRHARPGAGADPGRRLLHRLRGVHERGQARPRLGRAPASPRARTARSTSRSPTTASAGPTRSAARA